MRLGILGDDLVFEQGLVHETAPRLFGARRAWNQSVRRVGTLPRVLGSSATISYLNRDWSMKRLLGYSAPGGRGINRSSAWGLSRAQASHLHAAGAMQFQPFIVLSRTAPRAIQREMSWNPTWSTIATATKIQNATSQCSPAKTMRARHATTLRSIDSSKRCRRRKPFF